MKLSNILLLQDSGSCYAHKLPAVAVQDGLHQCAGSKVIIPGAEGFFGKILRAFPVVGKFGNPLLIEVGSFCELALVLLFVYEFWPPSAPFWL